MSRMLSKAWEHYSFPKSSKTFDEDLYAPSKIDLVEMQKYTGLYTWQFPYSDPVKPIFVRYLKAVLLWE